MNSRFKTHRKTVRRHVERERRWFFRGREGVWVRVGALRSRILKGGPIVLLVK